MSNSGLDKAKVEELKAFIQEKKNAPGPLMPVMQKAQDIFGCLSFDVQQLISDEMGIPMTDIYGVATFYAQFALEPKGQHVVGVCLGTACYVKNSQKILDELEKVLGVAPGSSLPGLLRSGSGHDDRRSGVWPPCAGRCCGDYRKV